MCYYFILLGKVGGVKKKIGHSFCRIPTKVTIVGDVCTDIEGIENLSYLGNKDFFLFFFFIFFFYFFFVLHPEAWC